MNWVSAGPCGAKLYITSNGIVHCENTFKWLFDCGGPKHASTRVIRMEGSAKRNRLA